ncbi:ABC transporter ATP-binding protein [Thermococcus sp.]|uniref:energy-coupling factor ABC transporter ATP-binding protein n=1 Tax=Thermococcus sp. TaxID=35749 RepID=UPI002605631A|nr:ABC transporter ATP-binding protein [Thermococcus sp.]
MILVDGLYHSRSGREVLRDINLRLERGEVLALLGPNGAGKTTLAKHLNGLLKPTRGRVLVDGIDTKSSSVAELSRKVGYVFQEPERMFFTGRVFDEVAFGPGNLGLSEDEIEERVKRALSLVGLEGYEDKKPLSLSGGEMRRLAMACVLAMETDYVILDEPTSDLDGWGFGAVVEIIGKLRGEGKGVLLVTHDVELALEVSDRAVILSNGRVVFEDKPEELLSLDLRDYGLREPLGIRLLRRNSIERTR